MKAIKRKPTNQPPTPTFAGKYITNPFTLHRTLQLLRTTTQSWSNPSPHCQRDTGPTRPSLNAADTTHAAKRDNPHYTGTAVLGIAAMHKSNLVPIFNTEQAIDTAQMRRG